MISASATHTRDRTGCLRTNRTQSAIISGAVNSISRLTLTGIRERATKYSHCTMATPNTP